MAGCRCGRGVASAEAVIVILGRETRLRRFSMNYGEEQSLAGVFQSKMGAVE